MRVLEILLMTLAGIWQGVRQDFNPLEIAIVLAGLIAWRRGWRPQATPFRVPLKTWQCAILLAMGAVAVRLAILPLLPHPVPVVVDEFSHLLLADTLRHGRVANPTHPFWQHFETIHVIQQPHYVSNYFPGCAAMLAAGMAVAHDPWAGVLAESALFLAVLYWRLHGWMPARWALFGIALAALRFGIASYWVNSYWGGFVPAIGGALVAGAYPRLLRSRTLVQGCVFGLGLAILALARPFEGFFFAIVWVVALVWKLRAKVFKIAIPIAAIAGAAVFALGMYSKQITGSPFVTAYQISEKTYGWPSEMPWMKPPSGIVFRHVELEQHYEYESTEHEKVDGPVNFVEYLVFRLEAYWRFYLGPLLTIPLLMIPRIWRRRRMLIVGTFGALAAILLLGGSLPHYFAPATALVIAIVVEGCRHLRASKIHIAHFLPAAMALVLALRIAAQDFGLPYTQKLNYQSWCCQQAGDQDKARIEAKLDRIPGNHLVFVKAKTDPYNLLQWIYNDADIDASRIVWARDMGDAENARLRQYFAGRDVWMVDPNVAPAACRKY